ncbi:MAG: hypothetical protein R6U39_11665 [Candidatus Aegiribacteria sp.]
MKTTVLKIINPLMLLLLLFQFVTAVFRGDIPLFFHDWHPVGGYILVGLGLLHLGLNWRWVKGMYG